jgi:hypothetical protein
MNKKWTKELIITAIQTFYLENNKVPIYKDFTKNPRYPSHSMVTKYFETWNKGIEAAGLTVINKSPNKPYYDCSKEGLILAIKRFYIENNKVPIIKDFNKNPSYPTADAIKKCFGSWNAGIEAAGLAINTSGTYGIVTIGLDKHLYRSRAEAYFVDNYLFGRYEYIIEPKYPNANKMYDWYIPSLDLYIELDGELRPETIKEKIEINKQLNRKCLFIKTKDIYKGHTFEVFYTN